MSMRRTGRRYLRGAVETTHDFQEFLNENPAVASGLASVGNLLLNAMMQSKYGPTIQGLLNPGTKPAAGANGQTAQPAAAAAQLKAKIPAGASRAAKKKAPKKKAAKKK